MTKINITLRAALFLTIPAAIAWISGEPFIFPSLGPTAYILAFDEKPIQNAKTIVGGHLCGIIGGLLSYHLIVSPYQLNGLTQAFSTTGLLLSLGGIVALLVTAALMLTFKASHPPACATTLIVSLGILSTWQQAVLILTAVVIMYLGYLAYHQFTS